MRLRFTMETIQQLPENERVRLPSPWAAPPRAAPTGSAAGQEYYVPIDFITAVRTRAQILCRCSQAHPLLQRTLPYTIPFQTPLALDRVLNGALAIESGDSTPATRLASLTRNGLAGRGGIEIIMAGDSSFGPIPDDRYTPPHRNELYQVWREEHQSDQRSSVVNIKDLKDEIHKLERKLEQLGSKECFICRDDFTDPAETTCGQIFCEECVAKWTLENFHCPFCRTPLVADQLVRLVVEY